MFVQLLPMYECYLPIAKKLGIPVVGTFSFHEHAIVDESIGNPHPLVLPFTFHYSPKKMTFFERLKNAYYHLRMRAYYTWEVLPQVERFYNQHYPTFSLASDTQVSLLFINNHPTFFSRATVPNLIEIAGIHIPPPKPLPEVIHFHNKTAVIVYLCYFTNPFSNFFFFKQSTGCKEIYRRSPTWSHIVLSWHNFRR